MIQYKIKFFDQFSLECHGELKCESHIQQDAKDEYSRRVVEADLPNGEYFSRLVRVYNGNEVSVEGSPEFSLTCKNHIININ